MKKQMHWQFDVQLDQKILDGFQYLCLLSTVCLFKQLFKQYIPTLQDSQQTGPHFVCVKALVTKRPDHNTTTTKFLPYLHQESFESSKVNHPSYVTKKMEDGILFIVCEFLFIKIHLLHFVAFFHVASLFSTGVENKRVGVDNKKALELTNSTVFHRGRQ